MSFATTSAAGFRINPKPVCSRDTGGLQITVVRRSGPDDFPSTTIEKKFVVTDRVNASFDVVEDIGREIPLFAVFAIEPREHVCGSEDVRVLFGRWDQFGVGSRLTTPGVRAFADGQISPATELLYRHELRKI